MPGQWVVILTTVIQATECGAHGVLITAPSWPAFKQGVGMTRKGSVAIGTSGQAKPGIAIEDQMASE